MIVYKRIILILLFVCFSFVFATEQSDLLIQLNDENLGVEIDSVKIYDELILQENKESSYGSNVVGIVVGSGISGVGTYFLVGGLYALNHKSDDAGDEVFTAIAGGAMLGISITLYLVGIPVLAYNIYKYNVHKNHAIKRDEYQDSLNRYKLRKQQNEINSVQLMLFPTVNIANAGLGVNAILFF